MKLPRRQFLHLAAGAAALPVVPRIASAQGYPTRPITMVVPFAAGGAVDTTARNLAPRLSEILGQQVVVENIGGAGGMTAASRVAKAVPDGYQILLGNAGTHAINQTLYKKPLYDAVADFEPIGMVARAFFVLIARKDLPAVTLPEFITYARANHAKMQFASAGAGSTTHLVCLMLGNAIGAEIAHVPYRSTAIAMQDLIAGRIDFICEPINSGMPQIQGNTVKAIAFLGAKRSPVLPNLPTAAEQGSPELVVSGWNALFAPKGTPAAIIHRLSEAASDALESVSVRERIEAVGYGVPPRDERSPIYLANLVPAEIKRWAGPIKASGVLMD
jgi:tripartite-type tricarboxylate transporter receptor subunit TctC